MSQLSVNLKGQAAVITGSTSGIGAAMAECLAANGCNIMVNGNLIMAFRYVIMPPICWSPIRSKT